MKEYYIYLTVIHHPRLGDLYYAGKKRSEGPEKDAKYHGSCKYSWWSRWLRDHEDWFETTIIDWFETKEEQGKAETALILDCLREHGAHLYGTYTMKKVYRGWLDQFGKGSCLNGHWQNCEQMWEAGRSPKAHAKTVDTMRENGTLYNGVNAMHDPEVRSRLLKTQKENGALQKFQQAGTAAALKAKSYLKASEAARQPDIIAKAQKTREENGSAQRFRDLGHKAAQLKHKYFYNGVLIYVGNPLNAGCWQKKLNQVWVKGEPCDDYKALPTVKMLLTNGIDTLNYSTLYQRIAKGWSTWSEWSLADFDKNFTRIQENS